MSKNKIEDTDAFRRELKALILKYRPEVSVEWGYYNEMECLHFTLGGRIAVSATEWGGWDFDDSGPKTLDEIEKQDATP